MLKRVLSLSRAFHLSTRHEQLLFTDKESKEEHQRPIEDLGCLVLEHPQSTLTLCVLQKLAAHNVAVVLCDDKHLPASMLFHLDTHYIQTERISEQVNASQPLRKQLWQQTVRAKILNQARLLSQTGAEETARRLRYMAKEVLSGDADNREAQAAQLYWPALMGENFLRQRDGLPPNPSLNYGYALLRAATARAIASCGLLPAIGIHHHNRYNAYCLADDLMEPYRPWVDRTVWLMRERQADFHVLHPANKARLLGILHQDVLSEEGNSPLMVALTRTAQSLARAFAKGALRPKLNFPSLPAMLANTEADSQQSA